MSATPWDEVGCVVREAHDGWRLVDFLSARFPRHDAEAWRELCEHGRVGLNGRQASADDIVRRGDRVGYDPAGDAEPEVWSDFRVLHEDDALLVVDKPGKLPCHRGGPFLRSNLMWLLRQQQGAALHLVNRLDKETSGLVIVAKRPETARALQGSGLRDKRYLCVVRGRPPARFRCERPIERVPGDKYLRRCGGDKAARTDFVCLAQVAGFALLGAELRSGRTHQIRVHLQAEGFPLLGERWYRGAEPPLDADRELGAQRQLLHATSLSLYFPDGEVQRYAAPPPDDFAAVVRGLGLASDAQLAALTW